MVMSTVSALAEARRTAYIRGRWVYTDNGGEHQYCIVEPTLPGNGDYTAYSIWCKYLIHDDSVLCYHVPLGNIYHISARPSNWTQAT